LAAENFNGMAVIGVHTNSELKPCIWRNYVRCESIYSRWWRCSMVRSDKQLVIMTYRVLASFSPNHLSHRSIRNFIIDVRRSVFTFDREFNQRTLSGFPRKSLRELEYIGKLLRRLLWSTSSSRCLEYSTPPIKVCGMIL
jgi:hypothetical protein